MIATPEQILPTSPAEAEALLERLKLLETENALLREELRLLKHHLFGRSRERFPDHPELFDPSESESPEQDPEPETETVKVVTRKKKRPNHPGRHAFPEHLPREVVEIPLSDSDRICSTCGHAKSQIGVEVTQELDVVPLSVRDPQIPGRHRTGYLWEYSTPNGPVIFDFQMNRTRAGPVKFLNEYAGFLQHDGHHAYDHVTDVIHVACMAHIRRKFWEAQKAGDIRAEKVVLAIKRLYGIEREAREAGMEAMARLELRQRKSAKRMELLKERIRRLSLDALPKSALGKACAYALGQWDRMLAFLQDGRIEIDNNLCENGIRPITLGRKNWLHIGSENAGPWTAAYASRAETCRRHGVNTFEYFKDIFSRIADYPANRISDLTPYRWKQLCDQQAGQQED